MVKLPADRLTKALEVFEDQYIKMKEDCDRLFEMAQKDFKVPRVLKWWFNEEKIKAYCLPTGGFLASLYDRLYLGDYLSEEDCEYYAALHTYRLDWRTVSSLLDTKAEDIWISDALTRFVNFCFALEEKYGNE